MKKSVIAFICLAMLFALPLASAGFWQWLTGKSVTENPTNVTIDVGNTGPTIPWVQTISAKDPTPSGSTDVIFKFMAWDHDGFGDLISASAFARFTEPGETERNASCTAVALEEGGEYKNYTCTVKMWYWDKGAPTDWEINVSIKDNSNNMTENSTTTFTYNSLTSFDISPTTLTWPTLKPGDENQTSNNDPTILNNTGNYVSTDIEINATDLNGTVKKYYIDADDFAVSQTLNDECGGFGLWSGLYPGPIANSTDDVATLPRGNLSLGSGTAQAKIYYCLLTVDASLVKQSYTTTEQGAWTIKIA